MEDYSQTRRGKFDLYVENSTQNKGDARGRRRAMYDSIRNNEHRTIAALVDSVGGNSRDFGWVKQAIADGYIAFENDLLVLPDNDPDEDAGDENGAAPMVALLRKYQSPALALNAILEFADGLTAKQKKAIASQLIETAHEIYETRSYE